MTELWTAVAVGFALWCLLSAAATAVYILVKRWPLISLGRATLIPAAEGTGARPASESGGIAPCAAPPQDASRPNRHYRPDPDYGTYRAMRDAQLRFMAEQVESTTYGDEVQR